MQVTISTIYTVPQSREGKTYIDWLKKQVEPFASEVHIRESTTTISLSNTIVYLLGDDNILEYTIEADSETVGYKNGENQF